jgi:hypothetical protein
MISFISTCWLLPFEVIDLVHIILEEFIRCFVLIIYIGVNCINCIMGINGIGWVGLICKGLGIFINDAIILANLGISFL